MTTQTDWIKRAEECLAGRPDFLGCELLEGLLREAAREKETRQQVERDFLQVLTANRGLTEKNFDLRETIASLEEWKANAESDLLAARNEQIAKAQEITRLRRIAASPPNLRKIADLAEDNGDMFLLNWALAALRVETP